MSLKLIYAMFLLACMCMGVIWTNYVVDVPIDEMFSTSGYMRWYLLGAFIGGGVGGLLLLALRYVTQELYERLLPVFITIVFSMLIGYFAAKFMQVLFPIAPGDEAAISRHIYLTSTLVLLFGFAGIVLGLTRASTLASLVTAVKKRQVEFGNPKLVDTSVIIDGRIADLLKTGFLEGTLIVPRFILVELQKIADSEDVLRRAKGRRGLDILKAMQQDGSRVDVEVIDDDPSDVREVDGKLLALAREYKAKIITNDFNLNKVAQIEGVAVLNINDLANALKPALVPDERIEVKIVKEGKEANQGVGYLDDGTMIVVDGGRDHIGRTVKVAVTSVLQTAAGRMIFTRVA